MSESAPSLEERMEALIEDLKRQRTRLRGIVKKLEGDS